MGAVNVTPCPKCGESDSVAPILYGLPTDEAMEKAGRGEILVAGCLVGDVDPNYRCHRCLISFDFTRPELAPPDVALRGWIEHDSSTPESSR